MQNETNERTGHPGISPCAADPWTGDRCVQMADRYGATPDGPVPACPDCARILAAAFGGAPDATPMRQLTRLLPADYWRGCDWEAEADGPTDYWRGADAEGGAP